jgi:hypothetical protein
MVDALPTHLMNFELTGDFGDKPEAILIGDRGLARHLAGKFSPRELRFLQHNQPKAELVCCTFRKY